MTTKILNRRPPLPSRSEFDPHTVINPSTGRRNNVPLPRNKEQLVTAG